MDAGEGGGDKKDIRRPMNAFLIFCKRHRSMVREKHPDRDNRSVTRILGDLWANLAEEEKSVYTNLAKQYKDAFMKANPGYKWHSTEKLPPPAKMATRPTNARLPRSLSASEYPLEEGLISNQLTDPEKIGGLNLLLMAGQQTRITSPDLSGSNSALLQLAEMCSSELHNTQMDDTFMRNTPPKKRARHWSYSEFGHAHTAPAFANTTISFTSFPFHSQVLQKSSTCSHASATGSITKCSENSLLVQYKEDVQTSLKTSIFPPLPQQLELKVHHVHSSQPEQYIPESGMQSNQSDFEKQHAHIETASKIHTPPTPDSAQLKMPKSQLNPLLLPWLDKKQRSSDIDESKLHNNNSSTETPFVFRSSSTNSLEARMPPKKKFTKMQETCKIETKMPSSNAADKCLSDQNDNSVLTCGKIVVDHIIDRLFSANIVSGQSELTRIPTFTDIEKARQIIAEDITGREKMCGPLRKDMGRLLSEVTRRPQNLVEKVIEEVYSMELSQLTKTTHWMKNEKEEHSQPGMQSEPETQTPEPFNQVNISAALGSNHDIPEPEEIKGEPGEPPSGTQLQQSATVITDDAIEDMQDDDDNYSLQPVRKSRRRNRGQRYQELINEGIIQPSKERLAARKLEQNVPANCTGHLSQDEKSEDDDIDKQRRSLKRANSESENRDLTADEKRYRTG